MGLGPLAFQYGDQRLEAAATCTVRCKLYQPDHLDRASRPLTTPFWGRLTMARPVSRTAPWRWPDDDGTGVRRASGEETSGPRTRSACPATLPVACARRRSGSAIRTPSRYWRRRCIWAGLCGRTITILGLPGSGGTPPPNYCGASCSPNSGPPPGTFRHSCQ